MENSGKTATLMLQDPAVTLTLKLHVLPTECIRMFCTDLRTNSDYFPMQH
jgi:hypothetical protein